MSEPHFFGYGSLVNRTTHIYSDTAPATLRGWRRCWVATQGRETSYLSVRPAAGHEILGLIARVPGDDWAALDERETGYSRFDISHTVAHGKLDIPVQVYAVPEETHDPAQAGGILLSYLDVVVQGFLTEFGRDGVTAFFDTTDGWDTPVLNDRADPIYPRHRQLSASETQLVDDHLAALSARIQQRV